MNKIHQIEKKWKEIMRMWREATSPFPYPQLTYSHFKILKFLKDGSKRASIDIGEATMIDRSTFLVIMELLKKRNLVVCHGFQDNGKNYVWGITQRGRTVVSGYFIVEQEIEREISSWE